MANTSCCGSSKVSVKVKKAGDCASNSCGCGTQDTKQNSCLKAKPEPEWVTGYIDTPAGEVRQVSTKLSFQDTLGSWKCRWSIGRMDYKVEPGIYCVGMPDASSPVLVTANYKMTFDRLREQLDGLSLWIVVLDTDGVNVWCAAGKGTFGTEELLYRISEVQLDKIVKHKSLILPQLGATGVSAHEVAKQSGFKVIYGTIRAKDIKEFLSNGMKATEEMRTVKFPLKDRIVLTPMELVGSIKLMLYVFGVIFILNAIGFGHYGFSDFYGLLGAVLAGCFVTPTLLPFIPGRAFSFKGALIGLIWALVFLSLNGIPGVPAFNWFKAAAYLLLIPTISAYGAMNFTGSSTFTSLSGVDREMRVAIPIMLFGAAAGILLLLISDIARLIR